MLNGANFFSEEQYYEALYEEQMGFQGDPRRCPRHPHVKISSDDGMFDGLCGICESEADEEYQLGKEAELYAQQQNDVIDFLEERAMENYGCDWESESEHSYYDEE